MASVSAACSLLTASPAFAVDPYNDRVGAFTATYQQAPPIVRTIKEPIFENGRLGHVVETRTETATLAAVRLVKRHGTHYALLISETVQDAGHTAPGAFSISYLNYNNGWILEKLWPEVTFVGQSGIPAEVTVQARFGAEPLILASSTWCGMGSCDETIAAFSLGESAPRFLGTVLGGAKSGAPPGLSDCENYDYGAKIGPPASKQNAFAITCHGWIAHPGTTRPKHWFSQTADYGVSTDSLSARPPITIPNCGR